MRHCFVFRLLRDASRRLKEDSQVMVDKTIAIPRSKITGRAGSIGSGQLKDIDTALRLWLDLDAG